jgi:endothelin-converting enzyme/putative endopeptidase
MRALQPVLALLFSTSIAFSQAPTLHGVDVSDLDRKADPCSDFFTFANGTWRAENPIPPSMTRWSKRWQAGETSKDKLKTILEAAEQDGGAAPGSPAQLIGAFYGACMDEPRVNARGIEPLRPWFAKIAAIKDGAGLQAVITELHDVGVPVPFGVAGQQDPHKPELILANVGANGYAMPDRDYYLKPDPRFKEAREKYQAHVSAMLVLAGWKAKPAAAAAQTVMSMETKFAEAFLDNVTLRDPTATDHNMTFAQLQALAPHFDWAGYFDHKKLPRDVDMNVDQPKYIQEFDRQLQQTPLADWKTYLDWEVLSASAGALSGPIVEEQFAFFGKYLGGATEMKPRWKRCVEMTDQQLGDALGKKYVDRYFPPEAKARMQQMVRNLLLAMRDDILSRPWMSDETKERAMAKIATFNPKIGYPDKWKDYGSIEIRRDAFFEDIVAGCRTDTMPPVMQRLGAFYRGAVRLLFGLSLEPRPGWYGWPAWRRAIADRWIYGLRLHDVPCAFKLFRKAALDHIPIQSNGTFVHAEILAKANFLGQLIAEVPISRLAGNFKGVKEPPIANESADRRRVFRSPRFVGEPQL